MAGMCHFWRLTPADFWDLDLDEYEALRRHQERWNEAQQRANRRSR